MKKLFAIILAAALVLGLAACGGSSAPAATTAAPAANSPAAPAETKEAAPLTINDVWPAGTTVTINIPAKAGGGTDLYTRYLTQALSEVCPDVNFVPTNYDTAEVGMQVTADADPDGCTLATYHGGAIIQYFTGSSNVSVKDDIRPVGILNLGGPQAIIARPDAPYKNMTELAEYMKANPGEVMIGCSLGGTTQMIFVSLVDALTGDSSMANYVQCASEADKLTQTASGSIDVANCSLPNAQAYEADGKLTILGTIGPKVGTLDKIRELTGLDLGDSFKSGPEQGVESATWDSCYYVGAPAGTPDEVVKVINETIMKACQQQSFLDGNKQMGSFTGALNYEETVTTFENEWSFMEQLVTDMGLKAR